MNKYFVSICVPSYNRPVEILRLLRSIDCKPDWNIQIVVCEDKAPKRLLVRDVVNNFQKKTAYDVKYVENKVNKGYDKNIRSFIEHADGEFIILMGDDDAFVPGKLNMYLQFLKTHEDLGYVLRSYRNNYANGDVEYYRYYSETRFFESGEDSFVELYRKSVFVSGFTFKKDLVFDTQTNIFDGTLLYQLYIQAEICLNHPSAYFNEPITEAFEGGDFYFGNSESEKKLYEPNKHTVKGEANFIAGFFKITGYIDEKYEIKSTDRVLNDMSKYSFPMLALVCENGKEDLSKFYAELKRLGFDCTKYFKFYYIVLYMFGPSLCRYGIRLIKRIFGKTPRL